jgi:chemotaxis protein methyltransferase CheR
MNDPLERVADLVEWESGIQARDPQMGALNAALGRISPGMDAEGFLAALDDPAQRAVLLGRLIDQVAVQETFFMREPSELEAIDWQQLLASAHARGAGEVNVWVSACASGEEAYSLAMLATEAFGHGRPPVAILATDISMRALRRAEEAAYSERSVRTLSPERRERFLVRQGARSAVGEQLRSLVRLRRHNLVTDPVPPAGEVAFDLVLCRNVLIYFGSETVEGVVGSLESALQPGGQLILGASDRLSSSARRLGEVASGEARPASAAGSATRSRRGAAPSRTLRKPLGRAATHRQPAAEREEPSSALGVDVSEALEAANGGEYEAAIEAAEEILAADPLNAEAYYLRGLSELAIDDPVAAVGSLRRALYVDPTFALAAFQLARAHELRGDLRAARRAYARTLQVLGQGEEQRSRLLEPADRDDIASACRARLGAAGD